MSKPFRNLTDGMSPERKKKIELQANELIREMEIGELRKALKITQEELAVALKMKQSSISRIEHQSDMFISTLRSILSAMGASLKIVASFPEGDVQINQFEDLRKGKSTS
ncbi:MAG TPA: helix-turn-helix transcriptional regulator [Candidatus Sabulitectum sp.]|nr:helix-turn-helix transcriptional regulator [Candidatus Sabulitectum sp.]HPJ28061.1 helix-turn-helix transcriptional regulator [Candidatus Sabulitectum sp.]HPR21247.1 helix-turn-helix transcriptional regulator [Candidatus Sabulitectum sp.]